MYQYTQVVWDYYLPWGCCFANRNHCMITTVSRYLATWKVLWNHLRIPFIFWQKNIKTNGDASKSLVHFLNCFSVAACVFVIDLCSSTVVALVLRFLKIKTYCTQILLWIYIYIYVYMYSVGVGLLFSFGLQICKTKPKPLHDNQVPCKMKVALRFLRATFIFWENNTFEK